MNYQKRSDFLKTAKIALYEYADDINNNYPSLVISLPRKYRLKWQNKTITRFKCLHRFLESYNLINGEDFEIIKRTYATIQKQKESSKNDC